MKFRFTVRGLFLLTTLVAILIAIGLWFAQSPLFMMVFVYLLLYIGVFSLLYVFRYRQQLSLARTTWKEHRLAGAALNEAIATKRAGLQDPAVDQSPGEPK